MTIIISTNQELIKELKAQLSSDTPRIYAKNTEEAEKHEDLDIKILSVMEYQEMYNNYQIYPFSPYFSYSIEDIEEFSAANHLALWGSKFFHDSLKEVGMETRFVNLDHEADDEQIEETVESILDSLEYRD